MRRIGFAGAVTVVITVTAAGVGHAAALNDTMQNDYLTAVKIVDQYWTANYTANFGGAYTSPHVMSPQDPSPRTACGVVASDNAQYCNGDDTLSFGTTFLSRAKNLGDLFIYDVVAHEWGHSIQYRANLPFSELSAECLAGAALGGAAKAGTFPLADGNGQAVTTIEDAMGGRPAYQDSDHGTGEQQANAYRRGWYEGPKSCVGSAPALGAAFTPPAQPAPTPVTPTPVTPTPVTPTPVTPTPVTPKPVTPTPAQPAPPPVATTTDQGAQSGNVLDTPGLAGSSCLPACSRL